MIDANEGPWEAVTVTGGGFPVGHVAGCRHVTKRDTVTEWTVDPWPCAGCIKLAELEPAELREYSRDALRAGRWSDLRWERRQRLANPSGP